MTPENRLKIAQEAKKEALEGQRTVVLSARSASLAFGIPAEKLAQMEIDSQSLVLQPCGEGNFTISLRNLSEERRDLWDEMVERFRESRSDVSQLQKSYIFLYTLNQAALQETPPFAFQTRRIPLMLSDCEQFSDFWRSYLETGRMQEGDAEMLQGLLFALWEKIGEVSPAIQRRLATGGITPADVHRALGIARSAA